MLKTFTAYRFGDTNTRTLLKAIEDVLTEPTATDPGKTMWSHAGFSEVFNKRPVFVAADNTIVMNVQIRERLLPARVIKEAMVAKIDEYARRQGYKPNRKQAAELKEEVTMSLLPSSHVKPVDVPVMITRDYLLIGTTSARRVDTALALVMGLYPDEKLSLASLGFGYKVDSWLMDLLINESTESGYFVADEEVVLKGGKKSVARFKAIPTSVEAIKDRISGGMLPVELAITYDERISFKLTDQMLVKGIKVADLLMKETESANADEEFEGNAVLMSKEINRMLNALIAELPRDDTKQSIDDDEDEL